MSVDPDFNQTLDPYGFANNNPISNTDPSGDCGTTTIGVVTLSQCGASNVSEISAEYNEVMKAGDAGGVTIIQGSQSGELAALYAVCEDGDGCSSWLKNQLMLAGTVMSQQQLPGATGPNVAAADVGLEIGLAAQQHLTVGQSGDNISFGTFGMAAAAAAGVPGIGKSLTGKATEKQVGQWFAAEAKAEESGQPVQPYEVGTYSDLKARSAVGDGLDIHHVPQGNPAGQVIEDYDYQDAPAIALPAGEHGQIPTVRGTYTGSPQDLLAQDIESLRNYTGAPEESIQELLDLNAEMYADVFGDDS